MVFLDAVWQMLFGLCAGMVVAAGLFTFISTLGIVTRLAQITRTANWLHWYENGFIAGGILGNLLWIFSVPLVTGAVGLIVSGLFFGIFTGCFIGAIAEILNAFPIFMHRVGLKTGIAAIIAALAAGKFIGVWFYYF
ncbi:stage V sporulation protein AB [Catenibacillus scindens]|uniref:stage V sporulation protein AB n=1 Tax=Catenibacillus scindens TaxID=673271 RepID=UPI00320B81F7